MQIDVTIPIQPMLLSGEDWFITEDASGARPAAEIFDGDPASADWIPASVPGNIQSDLEAAHLLEPLWYGEGDPRLWEVARKNWWYCKDFEIPADFAGKRLTLVFDGVDFESEVWLNGQHLGNNAGMFRRFRFDIEDVAQPGQRNRLAVRIARMPEELVPFLYHSDGKMSGLETEYFFVYANNKIRRVLKDLKSPMACSYDWATNVWTLGIWKDVCIEATGPARIEWVQVQTKLAPEFAEATVRARLEIDALQDIAIQATFSVEGHGTVASASAMARLLKGSNTVEADIPLEHPALWWPNGHGDQPMYVLNATLLNADSGEPLDARRTRFGVRDVRWAQVEGAPEDFPNPYQLLLNGRRIRTMGSNLVSPDLFPGRNMQRGAHFLRLAKGAGINTLRLHGGGVTLPEALYDLADELGLMISHEFPVANCLLESDPEFLANLERTARNILKQVRNHPAIIEYTGGNELSWKQNDDYPALHLMEKVVSEEDDRLFRATCPVQGALHSPWHYDPKRTYAHYDNAELKDNHGQSLVMRYGEFGTHSPANLEVWHREIPPASQWPIEGCEDSVLIRKNVVQAVFTEEFWLCPQITEGLFGLSNDLDSLIKAGQFIGAEGLRYSMDACRRRGRKLGGFTNWDYNEPWPNGAGSFMVDYDGRTLMNFDFVKQALAPVTLSIQQESIYYDPQRGLEVELYLVSDAPERVEGLEWQWKARDRRGQVFGDGRGTASIEPLEVQVLKQLALEPPKETAFGPLFLELQLMDVERRTIAERVHVFGCSGVRAPLASLLKHDLPELDDDQQDAFNKPPSPANPENLAYAGNGAGVPYVSTFEHCNGNPAAMLNNGAFGGVWIPTRPDSYFQIDLGKEATVGRFRLGRDRTGNLKDRTLDHLRIETSLDAESWQTVFEQERIAGRVCDRQPPDRETTTFAGNMLVELAEHFDYRPVWTLEVLIPPVQARHIRVTVNAKAGRMKYPAIDEFEVYGPPNDLPAKLPHFAFTDANEFGRPVRRTFLKVIPESVRIEEDAEILDLRIENQGEMTALFCEPHPLLNYRTDLYIENKNVCIPPGESRRLIIHGPRNPREGLSLEQTGWRITAWNAGDVILDASDDMLLSFGRQDAMAREFLGYDVPETAAQPGKITVAGCRPDSGHIPYRLLPGQVLRLEFQVAEIWWHSCSRLRIHTADACAEIESLLQIAVNDEPFELLLPKGLGLQVVQPAHLAFPTTASLELPAGAVRPGDNAIELRILNEGWITWDALDLLASYSGGEVQ